MSQIGNLPQIGMNIKKCLKQPPSCVFLQYKHQAFLVPLVVLKENQPKKRWRSLNWNFHPPKKTDEKQHLKSLAVNMLAKRVKNPEVVPKIHVHDSLILSGSIHYFDPLKNLQPNMTCLHWQNIKTLHLSSEIYMKSQSQQKLCFNKNNLCMKYQELISIFPEPQRTV